MRRFNIEVVTTACTQGWGFHFTHIPGNALSLSSFTSSTSTLRHISFVGLCNTCGSGPQYQIMIKHKGALGTELFGRGIFVVEGRAGRGEGRKRERERTRSTGETGQPPRAPMSSSTIACTRVWGTLRISPAVLHRVLEVLCCNTLLRAVHSLGLLALRLASASTSL